MNVIVKLGGVVTLPDEVVDELDLEPGSEVAFNRGPDGLFTVERVDPGEKPSREQIRNQVRAAAVAARSGTLPEFADMTTDEYMAFIRG
jgi:hypothetical protein